LLLDTTVDGAPAEGETGVEGTAGAVVVGVGGAACVAFEVCAELRLGVARGASTLVRRMTCRTR
jgi:hypothetical protein